MKLREVLAGASVAEWISDSDPEVTDLAYSSDAVSDGSLFFCVPGTRSDGHDFAPAAVGAGAVALVCERALETAVPQAIVRDARAAMAPAAVTFWGDPTAALDVAGITGTNGKTTTAFLLRHILERSGRHTGQLGTVQRIVGGRPETVERTTPEAIDLQRTFRRMLEAGDEACAMEVSSHALALRRTDGIRFAVATFTNLTRDHLDFHTDMEDYFQAKRSLFTGGAGDIGAAVINRDDPYGSRLTDELRGLGVRLVSYSASGAGADLRAEDVSFDVRGARFRLTTSHDELRAEIPLPGHFNVENALAALGSASALGVPFSAAVDALADAERVPGRLEPVDEGQPFGVLVDYAHTPDSLENVLRAARRLTDGRVLCVFGAGGDRDRQKRPLMGAAVAALADVAVVTSDNPRSEEPAAIIDEILGGIDRAEAHASIEVEPDRRAAIALAFARAREGDLVVIAGKGHEQGQEFEGGRKVPFDDREVALEELRELSGS